jgi:hypothetical protein
LKLEHLSVDQALLLLWCNKIREHEVRPCSTHGRMRKKDAIDSRIILNSSLIKYGWRVWIRFISAFSGSIKGANFLTS